MGTAMSVVANKYYDLGVKDADGKFKIPDANKDKADNYLVALGCMVVAQVGIDIWSCIDAVRIAKVKNQYYQDLAGKKRFSATMHPSVDLAQTATGVTPTAGMTLAIQF